MTKLGQQHLNECFPTLVLNCHNIMYSFYNIYQLYTACYTYFNKRFISSIIKGWVGTIFMQIMYVGYEDYQSFKSYRILYYDCTNRCCRRCLSTVYNKTHRL